MARQRYDITGHWLLHRMATGVRGYRAMPGEVSQSRKFPDGLLEVTFAGEAKPLPVLVELATFPEKRALKQALDDLTVSYNALGQLPELLMLVLWPKGNLKIEGKYEVHSKRGLAKLTAEWKPVEVWTLSAEEFLEAADVSTTPWVTLMRFDGPPERLLERCRERIERDAPSKDQADLLAAAQVLTTLRFPNPDLIQILGGRQTMIESPLIKELLAERSQDHILAVLKTRFDTVPRDVTRLLRPIQREKQLKKLITLAVTCPDLETFREALLK